MRTNESLRSGPRRHQQTAYHRVFGVKQPKPEAVSRGFTQFSYRYFPRILHISSLYGSRRRMGGECGYVLGSSFRNRCGGRPGSVLVRLRRRWGRPPIGVAECRRSNCRSINDQRSGNDIDHRRPLDSRAGGGSHPGPATTRSVLCGSEGHAPSRCRTRG
jgi:hypothetical protein